MKRIVFFTVVCINAMLFMALKIDNTGLTIPLRTSGAEPGYCGDPAGGNLNCTNCHSGSDPATQSGWITSNIPETGYVPDEEYTLSATATLEGYTKFGFEVSPQNAGGTFFGNLSATDTETQLTSNTGYITHTSSGTSGNGSKTWNFRWTAPASGSGPVTFYGAFNAANGNNSSSGDIIFLSTLEINESKPIGIRDNNLQSKISVYPNPVHDQLTIEKYFPGPSSVEFTSINGELIHSETMDGYLHRADLSSFQTGIYFITLRSDDYIITRRIIKF